MPTEITLRDELDALQEQVDQAVEVLEESYLPESTREELAEAIGKALDLLTEEEDEPEAEAGLEDQGYYDSDESQADGGTEDEDDEDGEGDGDE